MQRTMRLTVAAPNEPHGTIFQSRSENCYESSPVAEHFATGLRASVRHAKVFCAITERQGFESHSTPNDLRADGKGTVDINAFPSGCKGERSAPVSLRTFTWNTLRASRLTHRPGSRQVAGSRVGPAAYETVLGVRAALPRRRRPSALCRRVPRPGFFLHTQNSDVKLHPP